MTACLPHPVKAPTARLRARRGRLLAGCALGATLALGLQGKATAQAFNGSYSLQAGSVSRTTGTGTETLTVNSPTAVINWSTTGPDASGSVDFLPAGNTATFQNGVGTTNFVVLNRIFPDATAPARFDGSVLSRVNGQPGGTLLFQNSGGIILGSTAFFDVGSLVLTASTVVDETGYGDIVNDGGGFDFTGPPSPYTQAVEIRDGARIVANAEGSYVVLAAPRVIQAGSVRVNGSAVYVGAETWSFTINDGLFDIVVSGGSDGNPNPIVHAATGTTGGPASQGANDPHRIYMVTRPFSDDPVTMLLEGNIGFDAATSATVENGQIVLSAGFDIQGGDIAADPGSSSKYTESDIQINGGNFTSDVFGRASGDAIAESENSPLVFRGDLNLEAGSEVRLSAVNHPVTVAGDVRLSTAEFGYGTPVDVSQGDASITASNNQTVDIDGDAILDVSAVGGTAEDGYGATIAVGYGDGGTATLSASGGGRIIIDGDASLLASGTGGTGANPTDSGAAGYGGAAFLSVSGGGGIGIAGDLNVDVSGTGSDGNFSGGLGDGGRFGISSYGGGSISITGASVLNGRGTGGAALDLGDVEARGGEGYGGRIEIYAGSSTVTFGTSTVADFSGIGGAGANGGFGGGGRVEIASYDDAEVRLGGALSIAVDGIGGAGLSFDGGDGTGGFVDLADEKYSGLPSFVGGGTNVAISADGIGGDGIELGGDGQGGSISMLAEPDGGLLEMGNVSARARGFGGDGGVAGGVGIGGSLLAGTEVGYGGSEGGYGNLTADIGDPAQASFGDIILDASGTGGNGPTGASGTGGTAELQVPTGLVSIGGNSQFIAIGTGGNGSSGAGGTGNGGTAGISVSADTQLDGTAGAAVIDASGIGGNGTVGGNGLGGLAFITLVDGDTTFLGTVSASSNGTGGNGATGNGGNGEGRSAQLRVDGGVVEAGGISLASNGRGGTGGPGATGGTGTGGSVSPIFRPSSGTNAGPTVTLGALGLSATGTGGAAPAGTGGVGTGGIIVAETQESGYGVVGGSVALGTLTFTADATGGNGLTGGFGDAGSVTLRSGPIPIAFGGGASTLSANGVGGNSSAGTGADGEGGQIEIRARAGQTISQTGGTVSLSANGTGGNGGGTGAGGVGRGGLASLWAEIGAGSLTLADVVAQARGTGGVGGTLGDGGLGEGGNISAGILEVGYGGGAPATAQFGSFSASVQGAGGASGAGNIAAGIVPSGGAGEGGGILVDAVNGTVRFVGPAPAVVLNANGTGGAGAGFAGDGLGGGIIFRARAAGTLTTSGGTVTATAFGEGGDGGGGGNGQGGNIIAGANGGTMTLAGNIEVDTTGFGGDGSSFIGGSDGTGGLAQLGADEGGSLSFVRADVRSDGRGGSGAPGGDGLAGFSADPVTLITNGAFIFARNGTVTGQSGNVTARGFGGQGTLSDGGDGIGGTAQIIALNSTGVSSITLDSANLSVSATGGNGATSYSGGVASGGSGLILAETLTGRLDIDNVIVSANATGGNAGAAVDSLVGNGGNAFGGSVQVGTASGDGTGAINGSATFVTVQGTANAVGGNGVAATSNGGIGEGGALALLAQGGTLTTTGSVTFETDGTGGAGGTNGTGGAGTGGQAAVLITPRFQTTSGAVVTTGNISLTSIGTGGAGATVGQDRHGTAFVEVQGSQATFAGIDIEVRGLGTPSDPQLDVPTSVLAFNSQFTVGSGGLTILSDPDILVSANGGGFDIGGASSLTTPGAIEINVAGDFLANFGDLALNAGTDIDATPITATGDVAFTAGDTATFEGVDAEGAFSGTAEAVAVAAATAAAIDLTASAGTATLGTIAGGPVDVTATDDVIFNDLAGTDVTLTSTGGGISGNSAEVASLTLNAAADIAASGIDASGDVEFTAGGNAEFADVSAGGAFSGTAGTVTVDGATASTIDLAAIGGAATLGTLTATDITIRSRDIDILAGGRLGGSGTESVLLEVLPQSSPTWIGGTDDNGPGYTLNGAEAGRIRTQTLEIRAQAVPNTTGAPNLVVRDVTLSATPNPAGAAVNNLLISLNAGEGTNGVIQVEGALLLQNAGANDGIALAAPGGRVQVINPAGSIRVLGANGLPGGNLEIEAANIWSASQTIINQLAQDPNFAGRNEALLAVNGEPQPRGYIEGGEILLTVGDTLFVQNSGNADGFAGITVVQNTLTVEPTGNDAIEVFAFGRRINADGTFVVNSPYFREVDFEQGYGSGGYTQTAQFNQCFIATGACPDDPPPPEPITEFPVGNEIIEGPVEETEDSVPPPNPDRQEFVDVSFASESLLEEPVTSGGDSGVWDEQEDCPEGETCEPTNGGGN